MGEGLYLIVPVLSPIRFHNPGSRQEIRKNLKTGGAHHLTRRIDQTGSPWNQEEPLRDSLMAEG